MVDRWEDAEPLLVAAAADDLRAEGEVAPALLAFAGAVPRFLAWLRPFAPGAYHEPLIELLALAGPLDCDRLLLSLGARVWPLGERPGVDAGGDHRQRAVVLHGVDAADGHSRAFSALYPYILDVAGPAFSSRQDTGPGTGWIPDALASTVAGRDHLRASWADIADQAARVQQLGHVLCCPPDVATLLAAAGMRSVH